MKRRVRKSTYALVEDIIFIIIGIAIAIFLTETGLLSLFLSSFNNYNIFASFFVGIFFTSVFTLAPASIALANIAAESSVPSVALWGAVGAMCGDLILFFFIRDRFYVDIINVMKPSKVKKILHSFHFGFLKWLSPILGSIIIASPLPDELAISLLGMSKIKATVLMPIAFIGNYVGIYLLALFANFIS